MPILSPMSSILPGMRRVSAKTTLLRGSVNKGNPPLLAGYSLFPYIWSATSNSTPSAATNMIVVKKALTGPTAKITSGAREKAS
jgi:hypothetical protein